MKECSRCHIKKKDTEFKIDSRYNKPRSFCKPCDKEYLKEYYLKNRPPLKPVLPRWFCKKCNEQKQEKDFYSNGGHTCKLCANAATKKRYYDNPILEKMRRKMYHEKNKDKIHKRAAIYRKKINHAKYSGEKNKQYRKEITDGYIRTRLIAKGVKKTNITSAMIKEWRVIILEERIKQLLVETGEKICSCCNRPSPLSNFREKKWVWKGENKVGLDNYCKKCRDKYYKKRKKINHGKKNNRPARSTFRHS